jgi:hypothetical protein
MREQPHTQDLALGDPGYEVDERTVFRYGRLSFQAPCTQVKAMLHGAIFLATCNAILLLRDVN